MRRLRCCLSSYEPAGSIPFLSLSGRSIAKAMGCEGKCVAEQPGVKALGPSRHSLPLHALQEVKYPCVSLI